MWHFAFFIYENYISVVEYRYPEEAKRAIHIMNKAEFMGRPVFVREDREYENAVGGGLPKDPRDAPEDCKLSVGNVWYQSLYYAKRVK